MIKSHGVKILVCLLAFAFLLPMLYLKKTDYNLFFSIIDEDGVVEYATSLAYLVACVLAFTLYFYFKKLGMKITAIMYIFLSFGLLFIGMEEISWGQRIFDFQLPDHMKKHNYRQELNFHNTLYATYITGSMFGIIGIYGSFSRFIAHKKLSCKEYVQWYCPDYFMVPYFFYAAMWGIKLLLMLVGVRIMGAKVWWLEPEIGELYLGLGFLLFVGLNFYRVRQLAIKNQVLK